MLLIAKALNGIKALYKDELPRLHVDIYTAVTSEAVTASASCGDIKVTVEGEPRASTCLYDKQVCFFVLLPPKAFRKDLA